MTEEMVFGSFTADERNNHICKTSALESKLFELIKQESHDDYSAFEVLAAIQLLRHRLIGLSGLISSAELLCPRYID